MKKLVNRKMIERRMEERNDGCMERKKGKVGVKKGYERES